MGKKTKPIKLKGAKTPGIFDKFSGMMDKKLIQNEDERVYSTWICSKDKIYGCYCNDVFTNANRVIIKYTQSIAYQINRIAEIDLQLTSLKAALEDDSEKNANIKSRELEVNTNKLSTLQNERNSLEKQIAEVKLEIVKVKHETYQSILKAESIVTARVSKYLRGAKIIVAPEVNKGITNYKDLDSFKVFLDHLGYEQNSDEAENEEEYIDV